MHAGTGFNDLAGYIFGGNSQSKSMEMTTPVLTTAGQAGREAKMAFVMESKYDLESLPVPRDSRVERRRVEGGKLLAAGTFSGLPLDFEASPPSLYPKSSAHDTQTCQGHEGRVLLRKVISLGFLQVVEAERRLRGALLVDGQKAQPGYQLARYNDPFTLPFLRRNEVLIELEDIDM